MVEYRNPTNPACLLGLCFCRVRACLLISLALIQVGILLSYLVRFGNELFLYRNAWEPYFDIWVIFNLAQLFLLYFYNLYTRSEYQDYLDILESVVKAVSLGTVVMVFIAFFARAFTLPRSIVMISWVSNTVLLTGWRWVALYLSQRRAQPKRALIYGVGELAELTERCKSAHVNTKITPELFELVTGEIYLGYLDFDSLPARSWYLGFKRVFDLIVASLLLLILAIPMALIALAIKLDSKGPILFRQTRVGKGNRRFTFYKFRTMREGTREGVEPADVDRYMRQVTRVGQFLRKMRLDEIPQLFNVIKGDMSLVGPRPEWDKFVEKMARQIPLFNKRHLVRPGMAGWAQVEFKHTTDVEEYKRKLRYDLYYIKHMSPSLDIKALLRTLWVVITGRGAR